MLLGLLLSRAHMTSLQIVSFAFGGILKRKISLEVSLAQFEIIDNVDKGFWAVSYLYLRLINYLFSKL